MHRAFCHGCARSSMTSRPRRSKGWTKWESRLSHLSILKFLRCEPTRPGWVRRGRAPKDIKTRPRSCFLSRPQPPFPLSICWNFSCFICISHVEITAPLLLPKWSGFSSWVRKGTVSISSGPGSWRGPGAVQISTKCRFHALIATAFPEVS